MVRDDIMLSISSMKDEVELCGGLYIVISVKGREFTGWNVHLNASEWSRCRSLLCINFILFLYRTPIPPP